jgi:cytochrome c-type biogenesis protein CcmH/NrfG
VRVRPPARQGLRAAAHAQVAAQASGVALLPSAWAALQQAASAHRYNPLSVPPLLAEADAYEALGDHASARAALEQAIRLEPKNYEAWLLYGTYLAFSWGDENAGRSALMWAAKLSGGDESVYVVLDTIPAPAP